MEPVATLPGEPPQARALTWLPLAVRYKLDHCGLRISLAQWQALDLACRLALLEAPLNAACPRDTFARKVEACTVSAGVDPLAVEAAAVSVARKQECFADYVERKLGGKRRAAAS